MDIVIVANFCMDFSEADNGRFSYLADLLAGDNNVEIVTSSFYHVTKSHRHELIQGKTYKVTYIDEPGYKKNICLRRFYSHFIWGKNTGKYLRKRKKPDVVYCAVPSLTGPLKIAKYCKKNNIKFIVDVQDLWPESFQMVLSIPIISKIIFSPFNIMANGIYKRADSICAVSEAYVNRALRVNKRCETGTSVFLGTSLKKYDDNCGKEPLYRNNNGEIWIGYCGTLGKSYDLKCVIDALTIVASSNVKLIVMGDGPQKNEFEEYAKIKNVDAIFTGRLDYEIMCAQLNECDITVNPIVGKSVASIINKHADYAASGLPVLNTQNSEEYKLLIKRFNMGISSNPNDPVELANSIKILLNDEKLRKNMGKNSRKCAEMCFDRERTYFELVSVILEK